MSLLSTRMHLYKNPITRMRALHPNGRVVRRNVHCVYRDIIEGRSIDFKDEWASAITKEIKNELVSAFDLLRLFISDRKMLSRSLSTLTLTKHSIQIVLSPSKHTKNELLCCSLSVQNQKMWRHEQGRKKEKKYSERKYRSSFNASAKRRYCVSVLTELSERV